MQFLYKHFGNIRVFVSNFKQPTWSQVIDGLTLFLQTFWWAYWFTGNNLVVGGFHLPEEDCWLLWNLAKMTLPLDCATEWLVLSTNPTTEYQSTPLKELTLDSYLSSRNISECCYIIHLSSLPQHNIMLHNMMYIHMFIFMSMVTLVVLFIFCSDCRINLKKIDLLDFVCY